MMMMDRTRHRNGRFAEEYKAEPLLVALATPTVPTEPHPAAAREHEASPLHALRLERAKSLWRQLGVEEENIMAFHQDTESYAPGTREHQDNVDWWADRMGIEVDKAIYIDRKMRQADGRPTERDRPDLYRQRGALDVRLGTTDPSLDEYRKLSMQRRRTEAEIRALNVRQTALRIEEHWPHATHLVTRAVSDGFTFTNTVDLYNAGGAKIWLTGPNQGNGAALLAPFRTVRNPGDIQRSPMGTCVEFDYNARAVRYDLYRMQDVLAEHLL